MCFRPADTNAPVVCTNCGKKINYVSGVLPKKCPFCKTSTEGMEEAQGEVGAPGAPAAPTAPGVPAPSAPKPPAAPAAPKPPVE